MKRIKLIAIFLVVSACSLVPTAAIVRSENGYWLYVLQGLNPADAAIAGFSTIVTDYSRDGTEAQKYTAAELDQMRSNGAVVLCYLSIGEAESYRYYWQSSWASSPPSWLGNENSEWAGNYKVRYWESGWQTIILDYLDKILAAGFDGVYLDIIDAYEYWTDNENGEGLVLTEADAAQRMMDWVITIATNARSSDPGFLVYPQNGSPIIAHDDGSYLSNVSGIGVEDVFYDETSAKSDEEVSTRMAYLDQFLAAGKTVIAVDYVDNGSGYVHRNSQRIADFIGNCNTEGLVPYVARTDRALDEINVIESVQP